MRFYGMLLLGAFGIFTILIKPYMVPYFDIGIILGFLIPTIDNANQSKPNNSRFNLGKHN